MSNPSEEINIRTTTRRGPRGQSVQMIAASGAAPRASDKKERLMLYKAMAIMMEVGVPIVGIFEFLAQQCESPRLNESCRRVAFGLAAGQSLAQLARLERVLFSSTSARMIDIGMKSGKLVAVLKRIADNEEKDFQMKNKLKSRLVYPFWIAAFALLAAIVLPPLVLTKLLKQVLTVTDEPPYISQLLLDFSEFLSSPTFFGILAFIGIVVTLIFTQTNAKESLKRLETVVWQMPMAGKVMITAFSCQFLRTFAITYDVGLPVQTCLSLACQSTGSSVIAHRGSTMRDMLTSGESLSASLRSGNFLPKLACESIEAGEQAGKISKLTHNAADILAAELDYRMEALISLVEPLMLATLGVFTGIFALACLLPIVKLTESL